MQTIMDRMEGKSTEKKDVSEIVQTDEVSSLSETWAMNVEQRARLEGTELSTNAIDPNDSRPGSDDVCPKDGRTSCSNGTATTSIVHVQHAHSFQTNVVQTTTVLPRASSEQSRLRILTRTPAVQSMSSTPSDGSFEDVPQDINVNDLPVLKHQGSSKEESESGPPSLSSSRDSSFDYTDSTGTDLNEFIMKTLKNQRDKKMLLKLEKDFLAFISDPRKVFLQYPPMTSYHRMIVHRVAAYFGLDHNVDPTGKCIIVNKCANTRFPEIRFSELVREDSEEDPLPKLILKRQNSSVNESTPPERNSPLSRRSLEGKKSKSIEEREEEYVKARARIFNHGSLSSQSSASSKDGDCSLSGLRDIDDENVKLGSDENIESVADKPDDVPQSAVKVLSNRSRSPEACSSKLAPDVSLDVDASSSTSSTILTTSVTDSKFDSTLLTRSPETAPVLVEGAPYLAVNIPPDVNSRSKLVGTAGMIPLLSPNQTGGVVWTLPESQGTYSSGSMFGGHGSGSQVIGPEGYQAPAVGMQQGLGTMSTYFSPGQTGQTGQAYQPQPPNQPTPPQQQTHSGFPSQGLPMAAPFGPQPAFPMYQTPRMYAQPDLDMLSQQSGGTVTQGSPHGMVGPNTASPSSSFQELSGQLAGMSISPLDQQENQVFPKQRTPGGTYSPSCTQTYSAGQPVQYMVYRNFSGTMVATPISSQGQSTSGYLYSSPNHQAYNPLTTQAYNPQLYNQQIYTQQPFNQPYTVGGDQALLAHRSGSHTPPTPPPAPSTLGSSSPFMPHVPTMPGTPPRQQFPPQVLNPALAQVPARLMGPYPVQGQQLMPMPGTQQMYAYSQPYSIGQSRTTVQQPARFKSYSEKGYSKPVDIYKPDQASQRRPSPSGSPRGNFPSGGHNRRTSAGVTGKGGHGKNEGQRSQHQQIKGKSKHKKHRHATDSSRKQPHSGSASLETEQAPGASSCVLEVYDVTSNSRDLQIVDDLRQAGAQVIWNDKKSPSPGNAVTAKATFNSSMQAEQALRTNTNPNYKLRRCPPVEIPVTETHNY